MGGKHPAPVLRSAASRTQDCASVLFPVNAVLGRIEQLTTIAGRLRTRRSPAGGHPRLSPEAGAAGTAERVPRRTSSWLVRLVMSVEAVADALDRAGWAAGVLVQAVLDGVPGEVGRG
jgi:hypothetical protein